MIWSDRSFAIASIQVPTNSVGLPASVVLASQAGILKISATRRKMVAGNFRIWPIILWLEIISCSQRLNERVVESSTAAADPGSVDRFAAVPM